MSRDLAARLVVILESQINVPLAQFTPQTNFLDDLQMDDLEPVEVLMAVEEEFKIPKVPAADAEKLRVIDDLVRYLANLQ